MVGENYKAWEITQYSPKQFSSLEPSQQLLYLCQLGHLAPSTHNTQPWLFSIDEKNYRVGIYLNRKKILPASDVIGRQSVISVGCAVGNIIVGAEYFGLNAKIRDINPDKKSERVKLAEIEFVKNKPASSDSGLFKSIFTRRVVRAEYDPAKKISEEILAQLQKISEGKKTKLHTIKDVLRKLGIAEFQAQADSFVINSKKFSRELGDWLLPNDTKSYIGMPGAGFGLSDGEALRLHRALSQKEPLQPEDGLRLALGGKLGIEKSSAIGVITIVKDDINHWLEAGQVFEKMFLTLASKGISVAIHAAIVEVALVNKIFAATAGTTRKIAVLFRMGWPKREADKSRPHSPRLPIEEVILKEA